MTTLVINLKGRQNRLGPALEHAAADVAYIGRPSYRGGWRVPGSPLFNPFKVGAGRTREQALAEYGQHLLDHPHLLDQVPALTGGTLACWCAPDLCHGHLLAYLADQAHPEQALRQWLDSGTGGAGLIHGAADTVDYLYQVYDPNWDMPFNGYAIRKWRITRKTAKRIFITDDRVRTASIDRQQIEAAGDIWVARWSMLLHLREPVLETTPKPPSLAELKAAMANAHPDRGGTEAEFIAARAAYERARKQATSR